jgi:ribulose-phosphate 3-epimerase
MIEIDGGVTLENSKILVEKGVDILVAGNTVFGATDASNVISLLKKV